MKNSGLCVKFRVLIVVLLGLITLTNTSYSCEQGLVKHLNELRTLLSEHLSLISRMKGEKIISYNYDVDLPKKTSNVVYRDSEGRGVFRNEIYNISTGELIWTEIKFYGGEGDILYKAWVNGDNEIFKFYKKTTPQSLGVKVDRCVIKYNTNFLYYDGAGNYLSKRVVDYVVDYSTKKARRTIVDFDSSNNELKHVEGDYNFDEFKHLGVGVCN